MNNNNNKVLQINLIIKYLLNFHNELNKTGNADNC